MVLMANISQREKRALPVKKLEDYTDEEKAAWFDKMFKWATENLKEHRVDPVADEDSDDPHYMWEEVMNLLGDNIWTIWNSY